MWFLICLAILMPNFLSAKLSDVDLKTDAGDLPSSYRHFDGSFGANLPWLFNKNFVGLDDTSSFAPSLQAVLNYKLIEMPHEWRNHLDLNLAYSYSPPPDAFVKTADLLQIDSIYLYHLLSWFGFFGELRMKTSVTPGYDYESSDTQYQIIDAVTQQQIGDLITTKKLHLTNAFAPFRLEEQLGLFVQPLRRKELFLEFRTGLFGRELFASGQRVIISNSNSPYVVRELRNVYELGPALGLLFKTQFFDNRLNYRLTLDMAVASLQEPQIKPNNFSDRFSFDLDSILAFHFLKWLSLNWNMKLLKNPAVIDEVQFLSNLTLAVNFSI